MLNTIFGVFWLSFGLLFLIKPTMLQAYLGKKANRKAAWPFIIFLIFVLSNIIRFIIFADGFILKAVGFIVLIAVLRVLLAAKLRLKSFVTDMWGKIPLPVFRLLALCFVALGVTLLMK